MKKVLVSTILGLVAVANTFSQGVVAFNNYGFTTLAQVSYGATGGGPQGTGVNNTFKAGLFYAFGTVAWSGGFLDNTITGFTGSSAVTQFASPAVSGNVGFFDGGSASIPGYAGGPISFVVVAYNGADYATSTIRGSSLGFTLPGGIAISPSPAGELGAGLQPFQVNLVPEPSTFALAGLGLASLLIFRRRK